VPAKLMADVVQVSALGQFVGLLTIILLTQLPFVAVIVRFTDGSMPVMVLPVIVPELTLITAVEGVTPKATL
jgi:hypothetical protein